MPARVSSHVSAMVSGHGSHGTNSTAMAKMSEAMCSVRRIGRCRVTVHPSSAPHAPKQGQEQDGFHKKTNGTSTSLRAFSRGYSVVSTLYPSAHALRLFQFYDENDSFLGIKTLTDLAASFSSARG